MSNRGRAKVCARTLHARKGVGTQNIKGPISRQVANMGPGRHRDVHTLPRLKKEKPCTRQVDRRSSNSADSVVPDLDLANFRLMRVTRRRLTNR